MASSKTKLTLSHVATSTRLREYSQLALPEIEIVVDQVAKMVPAGNVPAMILNGLARINGRKIPAETVKRDINVLFTGVERTLDKAVYGTVFAGPAAVIWGYQQLLRLAGKNPEDAFPEGTWQFYIDYALREDTARHTNETHGFDTVLRQHNVQLDLADRLTAWVMASISMLYSYHDLLRNEWRERVYISLLQDVVADTPLLRDHFEHLYRKWERQRPYGLGSDAAPSETFAAYRQAKFEVFLDQAIRGHLPGTLMHEWLKRVHETESSQMNPYVQQMSMLAYLESDIHGETRRPIPVDRLHVGLIHGDNYYLIPTFDASGSKPAQVDEVRAQIATLLAYPSDSPPPNLQAITRIRRGDFTTLRNKLPADFRQELNLLHLAPIIINSDQRDRRASLSEIRQAERGIGDHPLTIFDTGETFVFDQSHIFFDGAWGAAFSEIITNEALEWAAYLSQLSPAQPGRMRPYALNLPYTPEIKRAVAAAPKVAQEVSAENIDVNLRSLNNLRKVLRVRNHQLRLTVNDILVLYRAIHAATYEPHPYLMTALQGMNHETGGRELAARILDAVQSGRNINPSILIPIDASRRSPRDRLYPMSFQVPLAELDLLGLHQRALKALRDYQLSKGTGEEAERYAAFERLQKNYLTMLAGFGQVFSQARQVALTQDSGSVGSIKLLAHMPTPLQRLLDGIPDRIEVLNDLIKGREVFSNIGQVVTGSTLTRFITAKDDNDKKTLVWGVITDAQGVMHLSLRDFRPHVVLLNAIGQGDLAQWIVQDYLDAYSAGLNTFVSDLRDITSACREHPNLIAPPVSSSTQTTKKRLPTPS